MCDAASQKDMTLHAPYLYACDPGGARSRTWEMMNFALRGIESYDVHGTGVLSGAAETVDEPVHGLGLRYMSLYEQVHIFAHICKQK